MTVDDSLRQHWRNSQAARPASIGAAVANGGGDGHPPGMQVELALLKQRADQADQRFARFEEKLDRIDEKLGTVATKATVWAALGTGAAIGFAVVTVFVAVLAYLQDQRIAVRPETPVAAPQPPVIIQLPPWPVAPPSPPADPSRG